MTTRERILVELAIDETSTLQEIGDRLGYSREYIRQIGAAAGIDFRARRRAITEARERANKHLPIGRAWTALVRSWLEQIGCGYCCVCKAAKPLFQMEAKGCTRHSRRCGECAAKSVKTCPSQRPEALKKYREANREHIRAYQAEWFKLDYQRNPERYKAAYQRKKASLLAQGPEAMESLRAKWRENGRRKYWKRKGMEPPESAA